MAPPLTMQEIILRLQQYWAAQGALLWQPYHTEVGAGTGNPATFLRVLGPEPWNVAYVEPSIRPDDSRYGENPNRLQMHTQFQVILKPDPGNPQELYLASLEALGIDRKRHDVRFVEDNWESPALGAWGLGWEVWLDGMEITQFTYFQQSGGVTLEPVAVELTYGLERIAMALQGVDHVMEIQYAPGLTYGEIFLQNEFEQSTYHLDVADTERLRTLFALYEQEALDLLERGLTIPAYDYILKCSHAFNVLDTRGAIGVTERAAFFNKMRTLSRRAAQSWLETREEMGFPLRRELSLVEPPLPAAEMPEVEEGEGVDVLLELGVEELPAEYVELAVTQLRERAVPLLAELRLPYERLEVDGTPRRLALRLHGLTPRQSDRSERLRGPSVAAAFDAEGKPTKAAQGFARSRGVAVEALERATEGNTEYVYATVRTPGRSAAEVLAEALPGLIGAIAWPKSMRWNASNVAFGRPLRWIVALIGDRVLPLRFAGVTAGRSSHGLRPEGSPRFEIAHAADYDAALRAEGIVLSREARRQAIWARAQALAAEVGGRIPASAQGDLLDEVTNLVEAPTPLRGSFEPRYLDLPREVLVTVMRKHQRYFPVEQEGGLLPYFITVANGAIDEAAVRHGNEEVIRARYSDAEFFWSKDTRQTLSDFRPTLAGLTFEARLGSMLDKSERLGRIVPAIARQLGLAGAAVEEASRAAFLAKADLVTAMVMDFTSLQGVMGRHYAERSGEPEAVAQALEDQYSTTPRSAAGLALGLADRLDSLVGLFAVGKAPRATADPFALRRAAIGVVELLAGRGQRFDLRPAVAEVAAAQPVPVSAAVQQEVLAFIARRLEQSLLDRGLRSDIVAAALAERGHDPAGALESATQLAAAVEAPAFEAILTAFARAARITRSQKRVGDEINPALFEHDEERALWKGYGRAALILDEGSSVETLVEELRTLRPTIDAFFEAVFVMADDEQVRANRLALLQRLAALPRGIADLSELRGF